MYKFHESTLKSLNFLVVIMKSIEIWSFFISIACALGSKSKIAPATINKNDMVEFAKKYVAKVSGIVTIEGNVGVLGEEPCYELNSLTLRLGKREHTKVLDLALVDAKVGDEIWIVSPSSLAYGIKGITDCITSRTPVLYKIKVLKTNE